MSILRDFRNRFSAPVDTTMEAMKDGLAVAGLFEAEVLATDDPNRLRWLADRLSVLKATLRDVESLARTRAGR